MIHVSFYRFQDGVVQINFPQGLKEIAAKEASGLP